MMTNKEIIAVLQAAEDGKKIERRTHGESEWWKLAIEYEDWNFSKYDFRIAPEPRRVPLGPQDVPPGSVVRCNKTRVWPEGTWRAVIEVNSNSVYFANHKESKSYDSLRDEGWEISRDGGKTWQPCWKEEV